MSNVPTWEETAPTDTLPIPSWENTQPVQNVGVPDVNKLVNEAIDDYDSERDDEIKASAIMRQYLNDLDPSGEVYFDKKLKPKQGVEELKKVTKPTDADAKEVSEIIKSGGTVLSAADPSIYKEPEAESIFSRLWKMAKHGTTDENYIQFKERMETGFYPNIGKDIKGVFRESKRKQVAARFENASDLEKAFIDGYVSVVKKPMLGASYVLQNYTPAGWLADAVDFDIGFQEALTSDINIWSGALSHSDELRKEWAENKGWLWTKPDFIADFILRSGPTMALSMWSGGTLAAPMKAGALKMLAYGAGSGFTESLSETAAAVAEAEQMGASEEEKRQVAEQVFEKNFLESMIFNSLAYGTGKFTKIINNKAGKLAVGVTGMALEAEQELRQDEISRLALNRIVAKEIAESEFALKPRIIEGLIDPEKRDITMLSLMMGVADPAMGYMQDLKATAIKTGKGKAVLDTNENYSEQSLQKDLDTYEATEDLSGYDLQRYEVLNRHADDLLSAVPELVELDTETALKAYNKETVEGVLEDATVGEEVKTEIEALPEPDAAASAETINDTIDVFQEVGLKKEDANAIRKVYDLQELTQAESIAVQSHIRNAKAKGMDHRAIEIANEVLANPERMLTPDEHMGLVLREAELQNQYDAKFQEAIELRDAGNTKAQAQAIQQAKGIEKNIDLITDASVKSGTRLGRAFNVRKARISRTTYSLQNMKKTAEQLKQGKLTFKQKAQLKKQSKIIKDLEAKVIKLEKQLEAAKKTSGEANAQEFIGDVFKKRKKAISKEKLAQRKANIKDQLRKMGHRVNDITGVTAEGAKLVSMLAEVYVEEGLRTLPDVMEQLRKDLPDLNDQTLLDSLGNRRRNVKKQVKSKTQKVVGELKRQALLHSKIMDAVNGYFDPTRKVPPKSKEVEKLMNRLQDLKTSHFQTEIDKAKVDMIQRRIDEMQDMIERGAEPPKVDVEIKPRSEELIAAQVKYREIKALMETNTKIRDLEEQIRTDEYKLPPEIQKEVIDSDLERARLKLHQARRQARQNIQGMQKITLGLVIDELGGSLRGLMASFDVSYVARQGGFLAPGHPIVAAKSFQASLQAAISQNKHDQIQLAIKNHPNQFFRDKYGLKLTDMDGILAQREEMFSGRLIERIPGIKMSERNMITGLNVMRASLFDTFLTKYPDASDAELKAYADYINSATGRGSLGKFERAAHTMARIFFAPRWATSRFQMAFLTPQNWKALQYKNVRKEMARDYASYIGTMAAMLMIAKAGGADTDFDPSSSDFGKIVLPNGVRVDLPGSMGQTIRLISAHVKKAGASAGVLKDEDMKLTEKWMRFASYKSSPIMSLVHEWAEGETVVGEEVTKWESVENHVKPLIWQTAEEIYQNDSNMDSVMLGLLFEGIGMGVQVYEKRKKKGETIPLKDL